MTTPPAPGEVRSDEADLLRARMVDELVADGLPGGPLPPRVAAAMRRVPRHVFVPELAVAEAYRPDDHLVFDYRPDGRAVTSISAPRIVALQLAQLHVRPGHRVMEIGTGSGYNAALLADLVGPTGHVTSIDIDPRMVARARKALADIGATANTTVLCADAADGVAGTQLFDRVIATVEMPDLPTAIGDRLAPDGRVVLPLRMGVLTRSIAIVRDSDRWTTAEFELCGFVPLRGVNAQDERRIPLHGSDVVLRIDDDRPVDPAALVAALATEPTEVWSGLTVPDRFRFDGLHLWLAMGLPGMGMLSVTRQAITAGLVADTSPIGLATLVDTGSIAYLGLRRTNADPEPYEFLAIGHGPNGPQLAQRLADRARTWDRTSLDARIELYPAGTPDAHLPAGAWVIERRHNRIAVSWPTPAQGS